MKSIRVIYIVASLFFCLKLSVCAQQDSMVKVPRDTGGYYKQDHSRTKKNLKGIYLGVNWTDYRLTYTTHFADPVDSIWSIEHGPKRNFAVAYVYYFYFKPSAYLRLGLGANFYSTHYRYCHYDTAYKTNYPSIFQYEESENIVSIGMPVHYIQTFRIPHFSNVDSLAAIQHHCYLLAGSRIGRIFQIKPVYFKKIDFSVDAGLGMSIKSKKLKFIVAPELRYGWGLNNVYTANKEQLQRDQYIQKAIQSARRGTFYFTINIII